MENSNKTCFDLNYCCIYNLVRLYARERLAYRFDIVSFRTEAPTPISSERTLAVAVDDNEWHAAGADGAAPGLS